VDTEKGVLKAFPVSLSSFALNLRKKVLVCMYGDREGQGEERIMPVGITCLWNS